MRPLAFLSTDHLEGFVSDDELAVKALSRRGRVVETRSWRQPCDWSRFAAVIVRSTWDYQNNVIAFRETLERIDQSGTLLLNPLTLIDWNVHKTYLQHLQAAGHAVVPTRWEPGGFSPQKLQTYLAELDAAELIIKPVVSANADHTYRLGTSSESREIEALTAVFQSRPYMVQPFLDTILHEGEYSLFYFNGQLSHAILKRPAPDDFRVQEEHGGQITAIEPPEMLVEEGSHVVHGLSSRPLYARLDFVRTDGEKFVIMEVELIEPSLYLRTDPLAAERFATAILDCLETEKPA